MLRLVYLAFLYWWYGGSLSSIKEELPGEGPNQASAVTFSAPAPDASSKGNTASRGNIPPPAPAAGSQLQHLPLSPSAAALGNAERGAQSSSERGRGEARIARIDDEEREEHQLKRVSIVDKITPLTVLTSLVSDFDVAADWYFFKDGLEGQPQLLFRFALAFTVIGTIMYILITLEFHPITKVQGWWAGKSLGPLQHVPLGWQLAINVMVEDIPQLVITWIASPDSVAGALNIATAGFSLLAKIAEAVATRRDLPMSSQFRMVEEDPGVVRHMMVERRNLEKLAASAAELAVLVNECRQESDLKRQRALAFEVMQLDPGLLSGSLTYIREKLDIPVLDLAWSGLKGPIPPTLGDLTQLTKLSLDGNGLTGSIPAELGQLTALTSLDLRDNGLTGSIPEELGGLTALKRMDLRSNKLTGSIPAELGQLTTLTSLDLGSNQLTGPIPSTLGDLMQLTGLSLEGNLLSGSIPAELGQLTALTSLYLGVSQLTGSLPEELGGLTALKQLELQGNKLTGSIPAELGQLTVLMYLHLEGNRLTGSIPAELGQLKALTSLYLGSNQLTGSLPEELGGLTALTRMQLQGNKLTGSIPAELGQLTVLLYVDLGGNRLTGPIPEQLGQLRALNRAWFTGNNFSEGDKANLRRLLPQRCAVRL